VVRLRNSKLGTPYGIDRVSGLTEEAAHERAATWWESRGTLAVAVLVRGRVDALYEREYTDSQRVPEDWTYATTKPALEKRSVKLPPPPPRPAPSVATVQKKQRLTTCEGCGRQVSAFATNRNRQEGVSRCAVCGMGYTCGRCNRELPGSRHYEGDDDPTPSGRLANYRCPGCGAPLPGLSSRQIWAMYTGRS